MPGSHDEVRERMDAYLSQSVPAVTLARDVPVSSGR